MRIAFIGQINSIHFYRRTTWYAERGHDVLIISYPWETVPGFEKADVRMLPDWHKERPLEALGWIKEQIEAFKPDVLHVHKCDYPGVYGLFLDFSPMVFTLWDGIHVRDPRITHAEKQLIPLAGQKSALFTCNSPGLLGECEELGVPGDKTLLTSWGVGTDIFNLDVEANRESINELRRKYGIEEDERVVFSPRVITNFSNLDTVAAAVDKVVEAYPGKVKFLLAGYVVTIDGVYSFGHVLNRMRHRDKVVWAGHVKGQENLCLHYQLADVVLSLYSGYLESSPASIIEGMLCGAFPVVADQPVVAFWVDGSQENGVLTYHRDPAHVAKSVLEGLRRVDADPDYRQRNFDKVLSQANYERTMPMMEKEYERLVEQCPPQWNVRPPGLEAYERGVLADVLKDESSAAQLYDLALRIDPGLGQTVEALRRLRARRSVKEYVSPEAERVFLGEAPMESLPPAPSGDMREYVWAAPLRTVNDCEAVHDWVHRLARRFSYDVDYLTVMVFDRATPVEWPVVEAYCDRYCPFHVGMIPHYLFLASRTNNDRAAALCSLVVEIWDNFDSEFGQYLEDIQRNVADARCRLALLLMDDEDPQIGLGHLRACLELQPDHGLAGFLLGHFERYHAAISSGRRNG